MAVGKLALVTIIVIFSTISITMKGWQPSARWRCSIRAHEVHQCNRPLMQTLGGQNCRTACQASHAPASEINTQQVWYPDTRLAPAPQCLKLP